MIGASAIVSVIGVLAALIGMTCTIVGCIYNFRENHGDMANRAERAGV